MADIGDIQQTPDGQNFVLKANGWQRITEEQAQEALKPAPERFIRGALEGNPQGDAGALGSLAVLGADLSGVGALLGVGAKAGARFASQKAGQLLGRRNNRLAQDVQARIRQQSQSAIAPNEAVNARVGEFAMELDNPIMAFEREAAERSVGAAERRTFLEEIRDEFTNPADLTAAQIAAIPHAERLGFQFIPGQIQGSKLLTEGVMTNPILRTAVEAELASNRRLLQTNAARTVSGMGDDAVFDADTIGEMAEVIGRKFDAVRDAVRPSEIPDTLLDDMAPLLSPKQRRLLGVSASENNAITVGGRDLMDMRSRLNSQMADAFKRPGEFTVGTDIADIIEDIDDIIEASIGESGIAAWRRARTEWRFFRIFDKPGVVDLDTGRLNILTLRNNLRRDFKSQFGRQSFGQRQGLTTAQSDFLDTVRVSGAFKENLGDSGTAGRSLASQLLTSPKAAGKAFIARRFIEAEAARLNR